MSKKVMEIKLKYKEALEQYNLEVSDLSEDAQVGVAQIDDLLKNVNMEVSKGKEPSQKTLNKIKATDKWVYYEILDFVNEEEGDGDGDAKGEGDKGQQNTDDILGQKVSTALKSMFDSGKVEWTLEEIKATSPVAYNVIFDAYKEGESNGIDTPEYSLIENGDMFNLSKK